MINTLREDILEFLRLAFYHNDFNKNVVTDEIMKLIERHNYISKEEIEKRIDKLKNDNTPKIANYTLMRSDEKALFTGFHHALNEVKKEMLK